jgi:hypothetical protein
MINYVGCYENALSLIKRHKPRLMMRPISQRHEFNDVLKIVYTMHHKFGPGALPCWTESDMASDVTSDLACQL